MEKSLRNYNVEQLQIVMKVNCSDDALHDLRWETLKSRREQHVLKLVKKCVKGIVPQFYVTILVLIVN